MTIGTLQSIDDNRCFVKHWWQ